jgi:uncharacterized membrane protein
MFIAKLLLVLFLSSVVAGEAVITSEGVVRVRVVSELVEGLNEIPLPVEPLVETIEARVGGELTVPLYEEGRVYLFSGKEGVEAEITYLAFVRSEGGVLSFKLLGGRVRLVAEPGVILLTPPENVLDVEEREGAVALVVEGPGLVEYVVRRKVGETPTETTPSVEEIPVEEKATAPAKEEAPPPADTGLLAEQWILVLVVAAALAGAGWAALALRRRRGSDGGEELVLTETDEAILERLRAGGGEAMQSELQRELALPKTTLWRHVRKLERLGLVEVEKTPEGNRVKLRRRKP